MDNVSFCTRSGYPFIFRQFVNPISTFQLCLACSHYWSPNLFATLKNERFLSIRWVVNGGMELFVIMSIDLPFLHLMLLESWKGPKRESNFYSWMEDIPHGILGMLGQWFLSPCSSSKIRFISPHIKGLTRHISAWNMLLGNQSPAPVQVTWNFLIFHRSIIHGKIWHRYYELRK